MIGNFIADHVKGKEILNFSNEVQRGIKMHREIDHFTDHHKLVMKSKERLYPKYHKYASVIVDMFYDHILAKNWSSYSPISLESFARSVYQVLKLNYNTLPERSRLTLDYMSKQDWLSNYAKLSGMEKALRGLSSRAKFNSRMEESVNDLASDYSLYEAEFTPFFEELHTFFSNKY